MAKKHLRMAIAICLYFAAMIVPHRCFVLMAPTPTTPTTMSQFVKQQQFASQQLPPQSYPREQSIRNDPIRRSAFEMGSEPGEKDPPKPNVFFSDPQSVPKNAPDGMSSFGTTFENMLPSYIGPNYVMHNVNRNLADESAAIMMPAASEMAAINMAAFPSSPSAYWNQNGVVGGSQALSQAFLQGIANNKQPSKGDDTINDMFKSAYKKYDVKRYLLQKMFANSHDDLDEDDGGFFSNKHLKRHGTAGVAAKVLGELIGIKIRESIEGVGKSFSEYAKDFTARHFVNLGQVFSRMLKLQ